MYGYWLSMKSRGKASLYNKSNFSEFIKDINLSSSKRMILEVYFVVDAQIIIIVWRPEC